MVRVPLALLTTQWVVLFLLAWLVLQMYRELARYLGLARPDDPQGLIAGAVAPAFHFRPTGIAPGPGSDLIFDPAMEGPALLLFADPTCEACEVALTAADKVLTAGPSGPGLLVVTSEPDAYVQASEVFRNSRFRLGHVDSGVAQKLYGAKTTPMLFAIGKDGLVTAVLAPSSARDIRRLAASAVTSAASSRPTLAQVE